MPSPMKTTDRASDSGSRMYRVERTRSTQKLPIDLPEREAKPRTSAKITAMPVAAEKKFWHAMPSIWVR
ncbi:hypothetical protein D3C87_852670 [compost metagenome]